MESSTQLALIALIVAGLAAFLWPIIFTTARRRRRTIRRVLDGWSLKGWRGSVQDTPELCMIWDSPHGRFTARIEDASPQSPQVTVLEFGRKSSLQNSFRLDGRTVQGRIQEMFGGQDILVKDEVFDDAFLIKGHDAKVVRDLLTTKVRYQIFELRRCGTPFVEQDRERLRVGLFAPIETVDAWRAFLSEAADIMEHLQQQRPT